MNIFSDEGISVAGETDINDLVNLLNKAYRGDDSRRGWTTEAHLIAGNVRTNAASVKEVIDKPGSVVLKYTAAGNELVACVNLQQHGNKIYLGMFAVSPQLQGGGVGKKMLQAAAAYARQQACNAIYMTVISVRTELIDWYKRHGYVDTGERKSFEEDGVSGKHLQQLEFMVLEKAVS